LSIQTIPILFSSIIELSLIFNQVLNKILRNLSILKVEGNLNLYHKKESKWKQERSSIEYQTVYKDLHQTHKKGSDIK